jgi:hypothetical protein
MLCGVPCAHYAPGLHHNKTCIVLQGHDLLLMQPAVHLLYSCHLGTHPAAPSAHAVALYPAPHRYEEGISSKLGQYTERGQLATRTAADLQKMGYANLRQHNLWKQYGVRVAASLVGACSSCQGAAGCTDQVSQL